MELQIDNSENLRFEFERCRLGHLLWKLTTKSNHLLRWKITNKILKNNPSCRLINPAKSEIGIVSKEYIDSINKVIR